MLDLLNCSSIVMTRSHWDRFSLSIPLGSVFFDPIGIVFSESRWILLGSFPVDEHPCPFRQEPVHDSIAGLRR